MFTLFLFFIYFCYLIEPMIQTITQNKKATFDYDIIETWEAWIVLKWYEVKAIREGKVNLKGTFVSIVNNEAYLVWCHISPIASIAKNIIDPKPQRKLFLHRKVIDYVTWKIKEPGKTLVPLEIYFSGSLIKVKIALVEWRKKHNKKQLLKERSMDKEAKVAMKKVFS